MDDTEELTLDAALSSQARRSPGQEEHAPGSPEAWMALLQQPQWQRLLSKAIYEEQWAQSYKQAHGDQPGTAKLIESLTNDARLLKQQPGLSSVVQLLKELASAHKPLVLDGDTRA